MSGRQGEKAFTLFELLIGMTILGIVLLAIISGYIGCLTLNEMSRNTTIATEDSRCVLEQMRSLAVTSLTSITSQNWTTWAANNGLNSLSSEQITVTYTDRDLSGDSLDDDPLEVTVTVTWQERMRARGLALSSLITIR